MTIPPPYDYLDPRSIATPPFLPPGTATAQPPPPMRRARMEQLATPPPRRRPPPPPLPAPPPEANVRELGQTPVIQDIHQERTRQREDPLGHYQRPPWWKQALGYAASSFRPTAGTDLPSRLIYGDPAMREMRAREEINRGLDAQQKAEQTAADIGIAQGRERRAPFDQATQRMGAEAASRRADVAGQVADTRAGELDFERSQPPPQPRAYKPGDYIPDSSAPGGYRQFPFEPPDPQRPFGVPGGTSVWNPEAGKVDYFNPKTAAPSAPGQGRVQSQASQILKQYSDTVARVRRNLRTNLAAGEFEDTPENTAVVEAAKQELANALRTYNAQADIFRSQQLPVPDPPPELSSLGVEIEEVPGWFGTTNRRWTFTSQPEAGAGPPPMQAPPTAAAPPQIESEDARRGREHLESLSPEGREALKDLTLEEVGAYWRQKEASEGASPPPGVPMETGPSPTQEPASGARKERLRNQNIILGRTAKSRFPGKYDHLSDEEVGQMLRKDQQSTGAPPAAAPATPPPASPQAGAAPPPTPEQMRGLQERLRLREEDDRRRLAMGG